MALICQNLHSGKDKARKDKCQVKGDSPKFHMRVQRTRMQKVLQKLHQRDCNDWTDDFQLKTWKVKASHPWRTVNMVLRNVNLGNEVLITWKGNEKNKIGKQGQVKQLQNLNDPLVIVQRWHYHDKVNDVHDELAENQKEHENQDNVNRG